MTKRDTIIVAVLINICVLAIIFLVATNKDEDRFSDQSEINYTLEETAIVQASQYESQPIAVVQTAPRDEVDEVLNAYNNHSSTISSDNPMQGQETKNSQENSNNPSSFSNDSNMGSTESSSRLIEVTVKRGDALEKIARANGTTVEEIKRINQLSNERLDIGQVLKVPSNKTVKITTSSQSNVASTDPVYYSIKSGDNPWKIARQFKVKYEDILRLNNMSEEKARNLKVGDKIRVK